MLHEIFWITYSARLIDFKNASLVTE